MKILTALFSAFMMLTAQVEAQWGTPGYDWRDHGRMVDLPCAGGGCGRPYAANPYAANPYASAGYAPTGWQGRPQMPPPGYYPHPVAASYPYPSEPQYAPPANFRPLPIHNFTPAAWRPSPDYGVAAPAPAFPPADLPPSLLQYMTNGTQDLSNKHYVGRNLLGEKKLFVKGQPMKNALRFFSF